MQETQRVLRAITGKADCTEKRVPGTRMGLREEEATSCYTNGNKIRLLRNRLVPCLLKALLPWV